MSRWSQGVVVGSFVSVLLALPVRAQAEDDPARDEARKLAYAGVAAYQASDYTVASEKLDRAFGMLPVPSVGLYSARALAKLGKLTEAAARYRQILKLVITAGERNVQEAARKSAAAELAALTPRIPGVRVQVEGAPLDQIQVVVDGNTISASDLGAELLLDPGTHQLQGRRDAQIVDNTIVLKEGEHSSAVLLFPAPVAAPVQGPKPPSTQQAEVPAPPQPASPLRTAGWVGVAAGGGALVLSGVGVLVALGSKPSGCSAHSCDGTVSGYNTWRSVSTVAFYAGAVLGATGVTLLLTAPKANPSAQGFSLVLQASGASFKGAF